MRHFARVGSVGLREPSARRPKTVIETRVQLPVTCQRQHHAMIVTGQPGPARHDHAVYVAGRYRDGALSDTWTDVARCARGTFTGFAPACTCGWSGDIRPGTLEGFQACQRALRHEHLSRLHSSNVYTDRPGVEHPRNTSASTRPRRSGVGRCEVTIVSTGDSTGVVVGGGEPQPMRRS
jgi:hypothetical protein